MTNIEELLKRFLSIKQSIVGLESISQRLSEIEPTLENLVTEQERFADDYKPSHLNNRSANLKKLRLLLEEIRTIMDDVESEADALDARVTIIENLRDRAQ